MKVKVFANVDCDVLEKEINEFIRDKIVVDIKFTTSKYTAKALVMYEEPLMYELHMDKGRPRAKDE